MRDSRIVLLPFVLGVTTVASSLCPACSGPKQETAPPSSTPATSSSSSNALLGVDAGPTAEEELAARIRLVVTAESRNLRACYEAGLAKDPTLQGHVVLVLEVSEKGRATRVLEGKREGLGDEEIKCFARVLKAAHFHDGAARSMRIQVPLSFSPRVDPP
jgi:hypothetical protein